MTSNCYPADRRMKLPESGVKIPLHVVDPRIASNEKPL
jgi:hypothetical protein